MSYWTRQVGSHAAAVMSWARTDPSAPQPFIPAATWEPSPDVARIEFPDGSCLVVTSIWAREWNNLPRREKAVMEMIRDAFWSDIDVRAGANGMLEFREVTLDEPRESTSLALFGIHASRIDEAVALARRLRNPPPGTVWGWTSDDVGGMFPNG